MTTKRFNNYHLTLKENKLKDGSEGLKEISFNFENHDDLFNILERVKNKGKLEKESDNTELIIGLKLFSEVMLRNKKHELFADFFPLLQIS